ncbi:MAG TPA: hypothetical protein VGD43_21235 [Micromonospora sp.]
MSGDSGDPRQPLAMIGFLVIGTSYFIDHEGIFHRSLASVVMAWAVLSLIRSAWLWLMKRRQANAARSQDGT